MDGAIDLQTRQVQPFTILRKGTVIELITVINVSHAKGLCARTEGLRAGGEAVRCFCRVNCDAPVRNWQTAVKDYVGIASPKHFKIQITRLGASVKSSTN